MLVDPAVRLVTHISSAFSNSHLAVKPTMSSNSMLLYCLCLQTIYQLAHSNIQSKFRIFEELTPGNFTVVVKRDSSSGQIQLKLLSFFALRKYFVLHLRPGSPVLRADFEAHAIDSEGRKTPLQIDHNVFFTGSLFGDPRNVVDAVHLGDMWIARIHAPDDVYSIEPLTHHYPQSTATSMVIFRESDVNSSLLVNPEREKAGLHSFCEEVQFSSRASKDGPLVRHPNGSESVYRNHPSNRGRWKRSSNDSFSAPSSRSKSRPSTQNSVTGLRDRKLKRQKRSPPGSIQRIYDTCEIIAIVDYEFYKGLGRRNPFTTMNIMIYIYQVVDRVFRQTRFGNFVNLGFVVSAFMVHTNYTQVLVNHYNMENNILTGIQTLITLASIPEINDFCLAHLTTQRNFEGTLGLAATAELADDGWQNGICAKYGMESRNIGLSTPVNVYYDILPVLTYVLVVTHELGHNWGSHHDPLVSGECSPSAESGGKYIMWTYSGQTNMPNSKKFSLCSRNEISNVLTGKAHLCFVPKSSATEFCGNGIIDPGEDCDAGYKSEDACCTANCRLQDGAICCPFNHPCCSNSCQIASNTQKCSFNVTNECTESAFCSGEDFQHCPQPLALPNNSPCEDQGRCWYGNCVPFCQLLGLSFDPPRRFGVCSCEKDTKSMCMHSCSRPENLAVCEIMGPSKKDGTPCMLGYCKNSNCVPPPSNEDYFLGEIWQLASSSKKTGKLEYFGVTFLNSSHFVFAFVLFVSFL